MWNKSIDTPDAVDDVVQRVYHERGVCSSLGLAMVIMIMVTVTAMVVGVVRRANDLRRCHVFFHDTGICRAR